MPLWTLGGDGSMYCSAGAHVMCVFFCRRVQLGENEDSTTIVLETQGADRHRATSSMCSIVVARSVTVVLGVGAVCGESIVAM